jgi:hypothetical protein
MNTVLAILKALLSLLGLAPKVNEEVKDDTPKLEDPPPPADKDALVHDLEEIRRKKFGQ